MNLAKGIVFQYNISLANGIIFVEIGLAKGTIIVKKIVKPTVRLWICSR